MVVSRTMRLSAIALAVAFLAGCSTSGSRPDAFATPESEAGWRWSGPEVALVGRSSAVIFERPGPVDANAPAKSVRIKARCANCAPATLIEFDVATPAVKYELDPGVAESSNATVVFPAEGNWAFEPLGGQITVRSPTSTQPPVVIVRSGSTALTPDCGPTQIENAVARYAHAFNAGRPDDLAAALNPVVDFSVTGEPLPTFATKQRGEVGDYIQSRFLAGERIHPYLVYAHSIGANAVDLLVYFVRSAPDLSRGTNGYGYRRAAAGSRLFCDDLLLLRFNAGLLSD
jgi:hypothetical protein